MPFLDRCWPLRLVTAALYVAAVPVFLVWYLARVLPHDQLTPSIVIPDAIIAGDVVFVLFCLALDGVLRASLGHTRTERRVAAINGYQDAMPLAELPLVSSMEEVSATADAFWFKARRHSVSVLLEFLFGIASIAFFTWLAVSQVTALNTILAAPIPPGSRVIVSTPFPAVSGPIWFAAPALYLLYTISSSIAELRFTASRIIVSDEGVVRISPWGRKMMMRWHELRLLEVASYKTRNSQYGPLITYLRWTLYSTNGIIRWSHPMLPTDALPDAFTEIALATCAQSHFQPLTFDIALLEPEDMPTFLRQDVKFITPFRWRLLLLAGTVGASALILSGGTNVIIGIVQLVGIVLLALGRWPRPLKRRARVSAVL